MKLQQLFQLDKTYSKEGDRSGKDLETTHILAFLTQAQQIPNSLAYETWYIWEFPKESEKKEIKSS